MLGKITLWNSDLRQVDSCKPTSRSCSLLWFLGRFSDLFHLELRLPIDKLNSGLRSVPGSLKLTAAGTVQDSHLFPSHDFQTKIAHRKISGKNTKNSISKLVNVLMCQLKKRHGNQPRLFL